MKSLKLKNMLLPAATLAAASLVTGMAYADGAVNIAPQTCGFYTLDCGHWYAGANLGLAHLHDNPNPNSGDNVDENGPGGSVVGGYQFNRYWGGELGFTLYQNSRETFTGPISSNVVAKTQHYAIHLAATGRYPVLDRWSALGKLGVAYSYAQKIATTLGTAKSSGAVSPYWGLGVDYSITPKIDVIAQFAEAVGNHLTGSTDLWSIGLTFALV